jgi:putative ABC transport system permease protein
MDWKARIRGVFAADGHTLDDDVADELSQHAAAAHDASLSAGCSPDEALTQTDRLLEQWRQDAPLLDRRARRPPPAGPQHAGAPLVSAMFQDIRYGLRLLRRQPGYSAIAAATIALAIAATTTLFSVADAVLLKPLPWPDADRLVRLEERRGGRSGRVPWTITNGAYLAWRRSASTVEEIGGWMSVSSTLRGLGNSERIRIARITPGMFTVLKARPATGRLFNDDDAASRQPTAVMLSHGFWQRRYGGTPDVIGRSVQLDDVSYTVVGVMPGEFAFPDHETQLWIPAHMPPVLSEGGTRTSLTIFAAMARMRPGVTAEQVAAEGTALAQREPVPATAALSLFGSAEPATMTAAGALDVVTADVRPAIRVLMAAVLLLLGAAVASVTTVQLARAAARRREMTLRAALGAQPARLVRQWLIETAMLGLAGGVLGALTAAALLRSLPALLPEDFPRIDDVTFDWRVALFAAAVTLLATLICGLVPALQVRRIDLVKSLSEDSNAPVGGTLRAGATRTRAAIMVGQVAVACVLLVGAGLLGRSLLALMRVDRGYDPYHLLTARLPLPPRTTFNQAAPMLEMLAERLRRAPGVTHVAFSNALPLVSAGGLSGFTLSTPANPGTPMQIQTLHRTVSPDYRGAMRLRVLAGRFLAETDTSSSQPVLVVNRSFAAQYVGANAIGRRLPLRAYGHGMYGHAEWEVVGVVDDMKQEGVEIGGFTTTVAGTPQPEMFTSYRQVGALGPGNVLLVARTDDDPSLLASTLRTLVREQAPSLAVDSVMTMEDRLMSSLAKPRTYAFVLGGFALFALAIAAVGLFGVLSYNVAQRTREIGVRTALGARTVDVVALVLGQAMIITTTGLAVGLGVATVLVRSLSHILYGVRPYDALTFVSVPIVLAAVAALACAAPAFRAATIDPLRALRSD